MKNLEIFFQKVSLKYTYLQHAYLNAFELSSPRQDSRVKINLRIKSKKGKKPIQHLNWGTIKSLKIKIVGCVIIGIMYSTM